MRWKGSKSTKLRVKELKEAVKVKKRICTVGTLKLVNDKLGRNSVVQFLPSMETADILIPGKSFVLVKTIDGLNKTLKKTGWN